MLALVLVLALILLAVETSLCTASVHELPSNTPWQTVVERTNPHTHDKSNSTRGNYSRLTPRGWYKGRGLRQEGISEGC